MNQKSWIISKKVISFLFFIIISFVFVRYGLQVNIPEFLIFATALLIVCIGDNNDLISVCICCIPLYSSFDYLYVIAVAIFIFMVKNSVKIKIDITFICILFIGLWEILHGFVGPLTLKSIVMTMIPFVFAWMLTTIDATKYNYEIVIRRYSLCVIGIGVTLLTRIIVLSENDLKVVIMNIKRLGSINEAAEIAGANINPNSLGIMCVLGMACFLQNLFRMQGKKKDIISVIILFIIGIFTLSRTFVVCLAVMMLMFSFDRQNNWKKRVKVFVAIVIILILVLIVLSTVLPNIFYGFEQRWKADDIFGGRLLIMSEAKECIWSNPSLYLFGIGLQDYPSRVVHYVSVAPHDAIHELLMIWGLPGLLLFVTFIMLLVIKAKKKNISMGIINAIPLIIIVVKSLAGHWISSGYTMMTISLAYLSLVKNFNGKNQNDFSCVNN